MYKYLSLAWNFAPEQQPQIHELTGVATRNFRPGMSGDPGLLIGELFKAFHSTNNSPVMATAIPTTYRTQVQYRQRQQPDFLLLLLLGVQETPQLLPLPNLHGFQQRKVN